MKNLDESKVYCLIDLSDEQRVELLYQLQSLEPSQNWDFFFSYTKYIYYDDDSWLETDELHGLEDIIEDKEVINALTLFEKSDNDRIIELQLEEQKLNNRLLEIAEEMKELTNKN